MLCKLFLFLKKMENNILDFCFNGEETEVERCLNEGISPNFQNSEGDSPLQMAAANGYLEIVDLLLKHGADIDLPNNYGWTPLMHASIYGQTSTVAFLLEKKAKLNIRNKLGVNAILAAVCCENYSTVKLLVEAGGMIAHMPDGNEDNECDFSSVMAACFYGNNALLQLLIESGADINHASPVTGLTPLMLAACGDHKYVINRLLEFGADASKKDICGRTALDLAEIFNNTEASLCLGSLRVLREKFNSPQNMKLLQAIKSGDESSVSSILEENPQLINIPNPDDGITPLILASIFGNYDIAKLLVSYGANVNAKDVNNGWTPLMHAAFYNHSDIVELLLDMDADVDICSTNGYTIRDLLSQNESFDPTIMESISPRLSSCDGRNSILTENVIIGGKLSAPERLHSKRSSSPTRVKDWIGGVAQSIQNKMHTHLSPRPPESVPEIELTSTDDSDSDVFLEEVKEEERKDEEGNEDELKEEEGKEDELKEEEGKEDDEEEMFSLEGCDIEESLSDTVLPPDLYLADILKEHKLEELTSPFPPPSLYFKSFSSKKSKKKEPGEKSSKAPVRVLRLPHLLKDYTKKKCAANEIKDCFLRALNKSQIKRNCDAIKRDIRNKYEPLISATKEEKSSSLEITEMLPKSEDIANSTNSPGELTMLLNEKSLQKYAETLKKHEVDMETFQHLTETDLNDVGIQNLESQKKLMEVIKKLQISE